MQYSSGSSGNIAFGSAYTVTSRSTAISNTFTPSSPVRICAGITDTFKVYGYNASLAAGTMRVNNSTSISAKYVTAITAAATTNAPLCVGAGSLTLTGTASDGKTFPTGAAYTYSWSGPASFSNTNGTTGITTPTTAASGTYTVSVTDYWGCTAKATVPVLISTPTTGGTLSGITSLCVGATATYSTTGTTGGTWSSSNTAVASVNSTSGVVAAVSAGSATITYSATNVCGTNTATLGMTVGAVASTGVISGAASVCQSSSTSLSSSGTGGTWSSSNTGVASDNATSGAVYGVSAGSATISYVVTGACGAGTATSLMTVNAAPSAGSLAGTDTICAGTPATYTSSGTSGGTWSSSNTAVASVNSSTGQVFGIAAGSATISYSVTTVCGTDIATKSLNVLSVPSAGTVSGTSPLCVGAAATFTSSGVSGGTWSSTNTSVAVINSTTGRVSGEATGSATISYTVRNSCGTNSASMDVVVSPLPSAGTLSGTTTVCPGSFITIATSGSTGGTWSSSNTATATVDTLGTVTGIASGTVTISYSVTNSCGTDYASQDIAVNTVPSAGTVVGTTPMCVGGTTIFVSVGVSVGAWSSSNPSIISVDSSTGDVVAIAAGSATISFTASGPCGTSTSTQAVTVIAAPSAGAISGADTICTGATTTYASSGTTGGTWSSSSTSVATVNSLTGEIFGVNTGGATISYVLTSACGTEVATKTITVMSAPAAGTLSGTSPLCVAAAATYTTSGTIGGTWSSSNASVAAINPTTGRVTGETAGSATITYTVSNACGSNTAISNITVAPLPSAGVLSGVTTLCASTTTTIVASGSTGGTWSSSNTSLASVDATGMVSGIAAGAVTVSYSVTNSCGTDYALQYITIDAAPSSGTIIGTSPLCVGGTAIYSSVGGVLGAWSSSNTAIASIDSSTGDVVAVGAGTATISYTVSSACGTNVSTQSITVNAAPSSGTVSGTSPICVGTSSTYASSGATGGTWSSSNASVASVNSSTGNVFGVSTGSAVISYSVTGTCGTNITTQGIMVNAAPPAGTVTGTSPLCTSASTTYTSSGTTGGVWTSSNTSIATVNATTGDVFALAAGSATISYTVSNACGSNTATQTIAVISAPSAGTISGTSPLCVGAAATFTTTGASGGTWTGSNPSVAVVNSTTGRVSGEATGSVTVTYTVGNACGTNYATSNILVAPLPSAGVLSGFTTLCAATTTTIIASGSTGGTWSSSNTSFATVDSTGIVTGISAGAVTISYAVTNSCGTDYALQYITIGAAPSSGTVIGTSPLCVGGTAIYAAVGAALGAWSSSNAAVVSIDSSTGDVVGVGAGIATISYTVSSACGTNVSTQSVTVNAAPPSGTLSGTSTICVSTSTTYSSTGTGGGTWSSNNTSIASVNSSTGSVYGVGTGTTLISYTVSGACGSNTTTQTLTVIATPSAGTLTGTSSVCAGAVARYTASGISGGTWSTSNSSIATIDSLGNLTGVSAGNATISYSVSNMCGTNIATQAITVIVVPAAGTVTGTSTLCVASTATYTSSGATGGTWSSSSPSVASVNSTTGAITGVAAGSATITYTVTNTCGTNTAAQSITINPLPFAGSISGASSVCTGASITLSSTGTSGGSWSSSNTARATVDGSGNVTGLAVGSVTISYSVSNTCGTDVATAAETINTVASGGTISGASVVCQSSNITLSTTGTGGSWSSSNTAIATVTSAGVVYGLLGGSAVISYTVPGVCGAGIATSTITVNPLPNAGTISGTTTICQLTSSLLTVSATGGVWSSSNTAVASVSSSGTVYGITSGSAIISYAVTNSCGTATATASITINPAPNAGTVTGSATLCASATTSFASSGTSGGNWSSSNSAVASVNTSTGLVRGVSAGSATISYSVTNSCGTNIATAPITINPLPAAGSIGGATSVCATTSSTLTTTGSIGGTWSSSNTAVASMSGSGIVSGVSAGSAVISYSYTNGCGTDVATRSLTVLAQPNAGTISGSTSVCVSAIITLASSGTAGGTWSSSNSFLASVNSATGAVRGLVTGTVNISYAVTNTCGTNVAVQALTINPLPSATVSGSATICASSAATFTTTATGGTWSSSNASIATVHPTTGAVTGLGAGTALISYNFSTATCGSASAARSVTIIPIPYAGTIIGRGVVSAGQTIALSCTGSSGNWSSSDTRIATVNNLGAVTGVSNGTATISYFVTNSCGTSLATKQVTVTDLYFNNASPQNLAICANSANFALYVQLNTNAAVTGRTITWTTTAAPARGTLVISGALTSTGGLISPVTANYTPTTGYVGFDSFKVRVSDGFNSDSTTVYVQMRSLPATPSITGPSAVCLGSNIALSAAPAPGVWSSNSSPQITLTASGSAVTVSGAGSTGVGGIVYYTYTDSVGCSSTASYPITVNVPGAIAGITCSGSGSVVCPGASFALAHVTPGGTWTSQYPSLATVSATGAVTTLASGRDTILYTIVNGCGAISAKWPVNILGPTLPTIGGSGAPICIGTSVTLTGPSGCTWTHTNPSVATLSATGVVTGVGAGIDTVKCSAVGTNCGLVGTATRAVTVLASPNPGVISGPTTVAVGSTVTLTSTVTGGTWSSVYTSLALVGATGIVRGVAVGVDTIKYSVSNYCRTVSASYLVTVTARRGELSGIPTADQTTSIRLYPNPTNSIVTLEINGATGNAEITITDVSGKVINSTTTNERTLDINMSNVPQGIYLVTVRTNGNVYREKVVVE